MTWPITWTAVVERAPLETTTPQGEAWLALMETALHYHRNAINVRREGDALVFETSMNGDQGSPGLVGIRTGRITVEPTPPSVRLRAVVTPSPLLPLLGVAIAGILWVMLPSARWDVLLGSLALAVLWAILTVSAVYRILRFAGGPGRPGSE